MADRRILTVVVGDDCSLCDVALARLRLPARTLGVAIATEDLDHGENRERYGVRVPVVKSPSGAVLAEGIVSQAAAWMAVIRTRLGLSC